jgi:hypothetical protein
MKKGRNVEAGTRSVLRQSDVIREVMLGAGECETWLTLDELAKLTKYPPASISAQLRHLRKPPHGAFVVEKRQREVSEVTRREPGGPVWEYRLRRSVRQVRPRVRGAAARRSLAL